MHGFGSMLKDYLDFYKISYSDFADRLCISQKHMNSILNESVTMSEELMLGISLITDIDVNLIFYVENKKRIYDNLIKKFGTIEEVSKYLNSFYLKEMKKRNWIVLKDEKSTIQNAMDLLDYLKISKFENINYYLDKRILYKKFDDANLTKIYLWIKRCDELIKSQSPSDYNKEKLFELLNVLEVERNKEFDKKRLVELFNKHGIYLVIEDALAGTKVRGCTSVKSKNPAIYITTYMKDKASFYYTLYHELAHVKTDYNKAKNKVIIDDGDNTNETKADLFALNQMIDEKVYLEIINNREQEKEICIKNNIPLCFLYSRLAYEGKISYKSKEYLNNKEKII